MRSSLFLPVQTLVQLTPQLRNRIFSLAYIFYFEPAIFLQQPICLLNVSFKIFTKVATNRLNSIADHVVRPSQTAFMQGRNILDGVVILHETVHEMHRKNMSGVVFKIDFEKAYDTVKWSFLQQALRFLRE